jgi:hypothetical protein
MVKRHFFLRIYLGICLLLFSAFTLEAQHIVSNPNDRLYAYLTLWEEEGLIGPLPLLRPYPLQLVKFLLAQVIERGGAADREAAQDILNVLTKKQGFRLEMTNTARAGKAGVYDGLQLNLLWRGDFSPFASYAINAGILLDTDDSQFLPRYTRPDTDRISDWASVNMGDLELDIHQSFFGIAALGNEHTFLQTGLVRNTFGPFFEDGAVLGPQAPHAGHVSFTHYTDEYSLNFLFLNLLASDDFGEGRYPQKYLSMQSFNWYPFSWLEVGAYETVVYGEKFNPVYLLPLVQLFYSQVYYGVYDNSLFGVNASIKLPEHVRIKTQLYADDLQFNDMVRFDLDTKYKLSLQGGVTWTPGFDIFKRVAFDYLLITPYMYTHRSYETSGYPYHDKPNYLNYTHDGVCLGSALEPNSDQFTLSTMLKPLSWLDLEPFAKWIRHGNASDGILPNGDGTIFDAGYDEDGHPVFQETTRFLSQDVLEHVFQLGLTGYMQFNVAPIQINVQAGYTFELVLNDRLQAGQYAVNNYGKLVVQLAY